MRPPARTGTSKAPNASRGDEPIEHRAPRGEPLVIIEGSPRAGRLGHAGPRVSIQAVLPAPRQPWQVRLSVADRNATLAEIVPLARSLSDHMVRQAVDAAEESGQSVACKSGCSACCRYLVPVSVPEALCLHQEIIALPPAQRERLQSAAAEVARKILRNPFPSEHAADSRPDRLAALNRWYAGLDIACPMLSDALCSLYAMRPLACREHLAVSSSRRCAWPQPVTPQLLPLPLSMSQVLARLAAEVEGTDTEAILLPLSFFWAADHAVRAERTFPAKLLVERLLAIAAEWGRGPTALAG
ncbi:MAG: YkgJ family cysteine cluster protein [Phycisphaerae bacterium]